MVFGEIKMGRGNNVSTLSQNYRVLGIQQELQQMVHVRRESAMGKISGREREEEIKISSAYVDDGVLDAYDDVALGSKDRKLRGIYRVVDGSQITAVIRQYNTS